MLNQSLRGVIAAIPTPIDASGNADIPAYLKLARDLLDNGCDALNVLGTTGEATSFSVIERTAVMEAVAANLPRDRLMVGTGAAAVTDAITLTRNAAELGFAGALLLPPFYYKNVPAEGVLEYLQLVADATADSGIPLYLYNFPAMSGIAYTPEIIAEAVKRIGPRIAGVKDSSGDLPYCRTVAAISSKLSVFPATEAALLEARTGAFAGCISASANVNADLCARAFHQGDTVASEKAVAIRNLFGGISIVSGVKAMLSVNRNDPGLAHMRPPLVELPAAEATELAEQAAAIRAS
ncbi:dihydrodipicolinate synthase family protein [Devosia sp. 919]|uniref:dihydrodipicolinate synthase family protein n=1 Tax=Devosia sp. 919 TaxID=2726065 RepID=UPI001555F25E|nr:dihydrodipicolinate synthase family protein [Devosia sp. 919]